MNDSHGNDGDADFALAGECGGARVSLGALVLGALEPQDRETIEEHVRGCSACSATLSDLAPIPGLLNRVDTADLDPAPPPPDLLERALAQVRTEQAFSPQTVTHRRRRWAAAAVGGAVAASVLVVVALVWTNLAGGDTPPTGPVAVSADPGATVSASVTMNPAATGTELALSLTGVESGEHCQLVAVGKDGTREVAATWVATYEGEAHVTGWTGLGLDEIATLEVTTPDGSTLATLTVPQRA
jgi:Putative zinc-finger